MGRDDAGYGIWGRNAYAINAGETLRESGGGEERKNNNKMSKPTIVSNNGGQWDGLKEIGTKLSL